MTKKDIFINERRIFIKMKNSSYLMKIIYFFDFLYKLIYKIGFK